MEKYLLFIILLFTLNCSLDLESEISEMNNFSTPDVDIVVENSKDNNVYDKLHYLAIYVLTQISYEKDIGENWKIPYYTYIDKCGDCEDKALLWMCLVNKYYGYKPEIWSVKSQTGWHAIAVISNTYLFGYINTIVGKKDMSEWVIRNKLSYEDGMMKAFLSLINYWRGINEY